MTVKFMTDVLKNITFLYLITKFKYWKSKFTVSFNFLIEDVERKKSTLLCKSQYTCKTTVWDFPLLTVPEVRNLCLWKIRTKTNYYSRVSKSIPTK